MILGSGRLAAIFGLALIGCTPAGDAGDAGADAAPTAEQGRVAVLVRQCPQCHQSADPNAGVLSGQTVPLPGYPHSYGSNLTPDPDTGIDAWDAATLAASVLRSVDDQGRPLCPPMPAYADAGMGATEALSIALYLQSLAAAWHAVPASACAERPPDAGL